MATYSVVYNSVGKGFLFDGGSPRVLYGEDFNPIDQWDYSADHLTAYQTTTNFNLSGFQVGHEVVAWAFELRRDGPGDYLEQLLNMDFLRSSDGNSWSSGWSDAFRVDRPSIESGYYSRSWRGQYAGIDYDEIWDGYEYYKFHVRSNDHVFDFYSPTFTVSNLNIDSFRHPAGFMWVDGSNLHFVDGIRGSEGYKHTIAYDGNYNSYVGTDYAGMIWLDTNTTRRIYYVDEYGYKRRTYQASNWFDYPGGRSVGTDYAGKIWVAQSGDADTGYGHLCFVSSAGDVLRILNGPPGGVA